jgi:hypothetical protein
VVWEEIAKHYFVMVVDNRGETFMERERERVHGGELGIWCLGEGFLTSCYYD